MQGKRERRSPLKDPPLRVPGQALDSKIRRAIEDVATVWILLPLLLWAIAIYEWFGASSGIARQPFAFAIVALAMTVIGAIKFYRTRAEVKAMKLGLAGERAVGQLLEELRVDGARIFHDVQGD